MFYCDAWNVSNERSYDANLVLVETINKQCNSKAEIRLISVFPREYEFKKKKKRKKCEFILAWLITACQLNLIEVKMKTYSSKVFIFSTFLIQSRNWHFKPGFFVVRKSIFNFSNWHLSIGKKKFHFTFCLSLCIHIWNLTRANLFQSH